MSNPLPLPFLPDLLTLQLWKDKRDWEKNQSPTKGSISLHEYLGWEAGFTLDKESQTLALVLKENLVLFAFDNRESLMRWQVRVTSQFEEGQHFLAHLIQLPNKSKLPLGQVRVHVQNRRFSMTHGVPPKLVHSWDLVDLRRYGALEGSRFCFEGGSRCGKGEGAHVLRLDDPYEVQRAFDSATKGKLEAKRKSTYFRSGQPSNMTNSSSFGSHLDSISMAPKAACPSVSNFSTASTYLAGSNRTSDSGTPNSQTNLIKNSSRDDLNDQNGLRSARSRSKSINNSLNWSNNSNDGGSTCDTVSMAISEIPDKVPGSPDQHLIKRKDLMERITFGQRQDAFHSSIRSSSRSGQRWPLPGVTPPLTPKMNKKPIPAPLIAQAHTAEVDPKCSCSHDMDKSLAYGNYDVPKSARPSGPMQHYDTPKSITQGTKFLGPYANYDIPHPGENPVPVFRKACGCLMKLVPVSSNGCNGSSGPAHQDQMAWACYPGAPRPTQVPISDDGKVTKIKLTGNGKMPVMDMRSYPEVQGLHPPVTGLPPKSPVYAVVNKVNKKKSNAPVQEKPYPNYMNVGPVEQPQLVQRQPPSSPYYENSQEVLSRLRAMEDPAHSFPNYVEMEPVGQGVPTGVPTGEGSGDTINHRLRKMAHCLEDPSLGTYTTNVLSHDHPLNDFQNFKTELTATLPHNHTKQDDDKTIPVGTGAQMEAYVTMPRAAAKSGPQPSVNLRRSSSVPCKSIRRSTSSSDDSGFSPGSPNSSAAAFKI